MEEIENVFHQKMKYVELAVVPKTEIKTLDFPNQDQPQFETLQTHLAFLTPNDPVVVGPETVRLENG
jgi:hypothetical protein